VLGTHQDAHVAVERLRGMVSGRDSGVSTELAFLMGELAERYAGSAAEMRRQFSGVYGRATRKRWRRLRKALEAAAARAEVARRQHTDTTAEPADNHTAEHPVDAATSGS